MFEVVLDYGEHDPDDPTPLPTGEWAARTDAFATHRPGFELRTSRLCRRLLMFHHFPDEPAVGADCLVRSTSLAYRETPVASFLTAIGPSGHRRAAGGGYVERSLPAVEFAYSEAVTDDVVHDVEDATLADLPGGVGGAAERWVDLDGDGVPGVLRDQAGAWWFNPPLGEGELAWARPVPEVPSSATLGSLMDLTGDGLLDVALIGGPLPGYHSRAEDGGWAAFRAFPSMPVLDWTDARLRLVDLTGDGHADVALLDGDAVTWFEGRGPDGFRPARESLQAAEGGSGPRLVFGDEARAVYLADMSGDGLPDLVSLRNGEISYWPSLGYGRFGSRITMDRSPVLDPPEQFDLRRVRLADVDGSGPTDLVYLGADGTRLYVNESGNSWSPARALPGFPPVADTDAVAVVDVRGTGTACLVWSSPLPETGRPRLRYLDLVGGVKPHLLTASSNNLGAETHVTYAASTRFALEDRAAGRPWATRLPFPVHVVERVETLDRISRNRFVSRYTYHDGYFDGVEREFRGFGMVEQYDTERFDALVETATDLVGDNLDPVSHVPPVLTRTWFHLGDRVRRPHRAFFREPGATDQEAADLLLDDDVLPDGLTPDEQREACRALKGGMIRQELYAVDGTLRELLPYTVVEQNLGVRLLQPRGPNRHAAFHSHPLETLTHHYERATVPVLGDEIVGADGELADPAVRWLADPRVVHDLVLEVDSFGTTLLAATVAYGRRRPDRRLAVGSDRDVQARTILTCTETVPTVDDLTGAPARDTIDDFRAPLPAEVLVSEITGLSPPATRRFTAAEVRDAHAAAVPRDPGQAATPGVVEYSPIQHTRTAYRSDDLVRPLPLGRLDPLALRHDAYRLVLTPGLVHAAYEDGVDDTELAAAGYVRFPDDDRWWRPSGRSFYSPDGDDTAAEELSHARAHFFLPLRFADPFHTAARPTVTHVRYDRYDLLIQETRDPLGNQTTAGERTPEGDLDPTAPGLDYRVLRPVAVMDPNRNRAQVAYDALGHVVGVAALGAPEDDIGDSLEGFVADLPEDGMSDLLADPLADPHALLGGAGSRFVYDVLAYRRTRDQPHPTPAATWRMVREQHRSDPAGVPGRLQHVITHCDGFGRQVQAKVLAEPGLDAVTPRWTGSGWTIFDNKGRPVRQYEPFFTDTSEFEFAARVGVSPVQFYDPVGRVIATLHPDHTYAKLVVEPWREVVQDANDTVAPRPARPGEPAPTGDPRTDPDIAAVVAGYFAARPPGWRTWLEERLDPAADPAQRAAAAKAAVHADTPTVTHLDTLGRPFLAVAHNRLVRDGGEVDELHRTRVDLDAAGHRVAVRDAIGAGPDDPGRLVTRCRYDLDGHRIREEGLDTGPRWRLHDAADHVVCERDGRGHTTRVEYDAGRRPTRTLVTGIDPDRPLLTELVIYGEQSPEGERHNLRGRPWMRFDAAGMLEHSAHDFTGNLLVTTRRTARDYRSVPDWGPVAATLPATGASIDPGVLEAVLEPVVDAAAFTRSSTFDALGRVVTMALPDLSVIRPGYNEANLLERVDVNLQGDHDEDGPIWTPFVEDVDYDAHGRRVLVTYGAGAAADRAGVTTTFDYDSLTHRLLGIRTQRDPRDFPEDSSPPQTPGWPGGLLQDLRHVYDPVGNVVQVSDRAQQAVFFRNVRVEPDRDFTYDARYRLVEATGREHVGQVGTPLVPYSSDDAPRIGLVHPGDGAAMGTYVERYVHDAVGNLLQMQHRSGTAGVPGWTRTFTYAEPSLLEDTHSGNRLGSTGPGEAFRYDANGNATRLAHLGGADPEPNLAWDHRDRLVRADLGGGGTVYFVSDADGRRVRKVWEKAPGVVEERLYLDELEIFSRRDAAGTTTFQRQTLRVADDNRTIALVENRTVDRDGTDLGPARLVRYQLADRLGSAAVELDAQARIVSYEEYSPFGSTTYQAVSAQVETPKRFRHAGRERDEGTGLYHGGSRYYAPWLGRWISADPAGLDDGVNLYAYVHDNPLTLVDERGQAGEDPDRPAEPKGAHGQGKRHSKNSEQKHEDANSRRKREQEKSEEKERERKREQRQRNPDQKDESEKVKEENKERKERYRKEAEKEREEKSRDPEQAEKDRKAKEREERAKEQERKYGRKPDKADPEQEKGKEQDEKKQEDGTKQTPPTPAPAPRTATPPPSPESTRPPQSDSQPPPQQSGMSGWKAAGLIVGGAVVVVVTGVVAVALVADDATGIGVADDVLLAPVGAGTLWGANAVRVGVAAAGMALAN